MENTYSVSAALDQDFFLSKNAQRQIYETHADTRQYIVKELANRIEQALLSLASSPTIKCRIKDFESFYRKYLRILKEGPDPAKGTASENGAPRITDLIGIRVVCPFIEDLATAEKLIQQSFDVVELDRKGHYTFMEFGYESTHLLITIPADITAQCGNAGCDVAEIQIRTILQDAWAEVEHELFYKAEFNPLDTPMKRKLAAVNANLSLADIIFQEIRTFQRQLYGQMGKRKESFYQKIEDATDSLLFDSERSQKFETTDEAGPVLLPDASIDDLLLSALVAHNNNLFDEAITLYSRILELKPDEKTCSLIYKHRGMANFAQSKYQDAIEDFSRALELDAQSYKAAYYRGVVHSVLKHYSGAIDDFSLSLEKNPYQAFCLFRRGQAYYHIGDYPQALSDCEASIALEPANET
ncbi:MAG: tetratricopeptide repeat protein, partial [Treponema sp.]|nr:tetratricopeptide repeat protein [Treponema sp.]